MKPILFLTLFLGISINSNAQKYFWQQTNLAVFTGLEVTTVTSSPLEDRFSTTTGQTGFSIGPMLQVPLSKRFFFRGGLLMTDRRYSIETQLFESFNFFIPSNFPREDFIDLNNFTINSQVNQVALDWSFALGYIFPGENLNWYTLGGFVYHMYIAERNFERLENHPLIETGTISREIEIDLNNTNWSFQMGMGCNIKLNHFMALFLETNLNYNLNRVRIANKVDERYNSWRLGGGLNLYLN